MRSGRALYWLRISGFIAILLQCSGSARAQAEKADERKFSLTDSKYEGVIVANVGNVKITAQEFLMNYEFGPAFTKRQHNSKLRHLNFMINEKLFALEGYARGLQKTQHTREALAEIEGDLATEELYMQDVASHITVSDEEIADGIQKKKTTLALRWMFSSTESGIATYQKLLRGGSPFDSVFTLQLRDGVRAEDRSLQTTRFDLVMKNPVLAHIVDSLATGTVSLPIHVDDEWYIVQLTGRETSPIMTQTEEERLREDVHRALVQRLSDHRSDQYVNQLVTNENPIIERRAFDIVQTYLARSIVPHDRFVEWRMADLLIKKWGTVDFTRIEPFRDLTIVTHRHGKLTVADFLRWYDARSTGIHLAVSSPQAFFVSFEGFVWRMVRDKLLVQRALKRHLQVRPAVRKQKKWWEEKILYELEKSIIGKSIPMDSSVLREYYLSHQRDYRDDAGNARPYENVKDDVLRGYYASALNERMLHRVLALKTKYNITIDEPALESLPVDSENQPGAIDVYAVKKGGTFPRPAFPSIDYRWQEWN
jgi:hypothetical protein